MEAAAVVAAEATAAWKIRFRQVVVEADERCRQLPGMITAVLQHLESPALMGNDGERRARIQLAREAAERASDELDFAISVATRANLLQGISIRGVPTLPLHSLQDLLGDNNPARQNALDKLRQAKVCAQEASVAVKVCCVNLLGMDLLLDHPGLPQGVADGFFNGERLLAIANLRDPAIGAMGLAQSCAQLVAGARQDVDGAN